MSDPAGLPVYSKPWTSVADQLSLLESRGLIVTERPAAENTLRHLNYYRFSGYCLAFEDERHRFRNDVTFADDLQNSQTMSLLRRICRPVAAAHQRADAGSTRNARRTDADGHAAGLVQTSILGLGTW